MVWNYLWRKKASLTPGEAASKRRVYIFALCVLFSALFWLFIKLSQETSASFHKYIHFKDFPEELVVASQSDSIIHYRIITTGVRLFNAYFFRSPDTLKLSVNGLSTLRRDGKELHVVTDIQIYEMLSANAGGLTTVSHIRPDTIFLELVPAKRRKLPVRLNADIRFAQRFRAYGPIRIEPDSIWITGPKNILDTLQYVSTEYWDSGSLRETTRANIPVKKPIEIKSIELEKKEVAVEVPVTEFTESSIELPVIINCPEEHAASEIRLFPNTVRVSYLVALRDYASVSPEMFQAIVICPQVQQIPEGRLEVSVEKHPPFIDILAIKPPFVEYIILE